MVDIRNNHRKFIAEFIELYKSFPTLWNVKSQEYNDRDNKREAYVQLVQKLKEIEPNCCKLDVIKKINSLRSAFRREYRKVKTMRACGKLYNPTLWYYDLISFTITETRPRYRDRHVPEKHKIHSNNVVLEDPLNLNTTSIKQETDEIMIEEFSPLEVEGNNLLSTEEETNIQSIKVPQDEYDAIGYNVASKLRNMDKKQSIIAERIIAETLFQGQMGVLRVNTTPSVVIPTLPYNKFVNDTAKLPP